MLCELIFKMSCGITLVDGTARSLIGGDLDQRETGLRSCASWCMMGVVFNPQAPKSHFLPLLGQDGTKFEIYFIIRLHIWPNFNTYSCFHLWNPLNPCRCQDRRVAHQLLQKTQNSPVQSSPRLCIATQPLPATIVCCTSWHLMYALIVRT